MDDEEIKTSYQKIEQISGEIQSGHMINKNVFQRLFIHTSLVCFLVSSTKQIISNLVLHHVSYVYRVH